MRPAASIRHVAPKSLIGIGARMSIRNDATAGLWRTLMPRRREIVGRLSTSYVSMRVYAPGIASNLESMLSGDFEKWAAVEVEPGSRVPDGMRAYRLNGGDYAVFRHRGPASRFQDTMRYILADWLPASGYLLDDREHFEVLPENWAAEDDDAYEDIFIPIRR